jgi:hypothetical protein
MHWITNVGCSPVIAHSFADPRNLVGSDTFFFGQGCEPTSLPFYRRFFGMLGQNIYNIDTDGKQLLRVLIMVRTPSSIWLLSLAEWLA